MLRLEACDVDDTTAQITLRVQATQTHALCPLCATPARRIHSDSNRGAFGMRVIFPDW
jgi:hypothetical protein